MLHDVNAFLGAWPFHLEPELSAAQLADRLARAGVGRAAVSPLGAVFQPEPMPANRRLFAAVRRERMLSPLPVVNPLLADWRAQLAECRDAAGVRAVRLLPNYHGYAPDARRLDDFMAAAATSGLRVVLTARLEDDRQRYFGLKVKNVPLAGIGRFLKRYSDHQVLCTALSLGEILHLAAQHRNFSADLSYAEHIALAAKLRGRMPFRRLMFGTLAPLISIPAQTSKLTHSSFTPAERQQIGSANARTFFAP